MANELQSNIGTAPTESRVVAQRPRRTSGPTIRDVARECGVSAMTVSAVLNNRKGDVSTQTRERVLTCIRRLDYQPSAAARALSRKRTDTIGVAFGIVGAAAAVTNPYMSGILEGVLREAEKFGFDVNLVNRHWHSAEKSASLFKDQRTDGLLLIAPVRESDIVSGLANLGRPLITVSGDSQLYGIASVDTDDAKVGAFAVRHLVTLGHCRIAHITGNDDLTSTRRRLASYRAAMTAHDLPIQPGYAHHASYSGAGVPEAVAAMMGLNEPPTAIFCGNDNIAFQAIRSLNDLGYSVPGDVSVVGVDDVDAAARVTPPLTTIRQSLGQIGVLATSLLIGCIDNRPVDVSDHFVAPELVVRESTAPPKA